MYYKNCYNCGNKFDRDPRISQRQWYGRKFCSANCQRKGRDFTNVGGQNKGMKQPWKKNKVSPLLEQIRKLWEYRKWRTAVFERDGYKCVTCGQLGGKLVVDHIKSFASIFYENEIKTLEQAINCIEFWNIGGGRTLCEPCHKKTPTYLKSYKKQLYEQARSN